MKTFWLPSDSSDDTDAEMWCEELMLPPEGKLLKAAESFGYKQVKCPICQGKGVIFETSERSYR